MNKKTISLDEQFEGKVKRLQLTIQDVPIYKSPEDKETLVGNKPAIFGTLQLHQKDAKGKIKKKVKNVNFTLPLDNNVEFRNHVIAMIAEAVMLDNKSISKNISLSASKPSK